MRIIKFNLLGIRQFRSEIGSLFSRAGEAAIVIRAQPRLLVLRCPCGCDQDVAVNLDERAGRAWRMYQNTQGVTLFPSVWRDTDCGSHFIIWNNLIYLFSSRGEGLESAVESSATSAAEVDRILSTLSTDQFMSLDEIADRTGATPWDTLVACRQLTRRGHLEEGFASAAASFRLRK
jgi:hypothetical protein